MCVLELNVGLLKAKLLTTEPSSQSLEACSYPQKIPLNIFIFSKHKKYRLKQDKCQVLILKKGISEFYKGRHTC